MKHVILYFGSFNPIHKGHTALAEYVLRQGLGDEVVLVVSPRNPLKPAADLAPETERFEMAEAACKATAFPERIRPSVIEFLLEKPSYTIHTLRHLSAEYGAQMRFSILMGADLLPQLSQWKEYTEILERYPILVYPRRGFGPGLYADRVTWLADAPLQDFSSTDIRERIERGESVADMVAPAVERYIREKGLWTPAHRLSTLTALIEAHPGDAGLYVERGKWHYRLNAWGDALNDFNRALAIDPGHCEARQFAGMVQEILEYRYKDIYNP